MYPLLRRGDRLPTVVVAQFLLNEALEAGNYIAADGIFGPITRRAVEDFQRRKSLNPTGQVDEATWRELNRQRGLQVVDSVDATDPDILDHEYIRRAGGTALEYHGMSNGIHQATMDIQRIARSGNVVLLRFHGHGGPGEMLVTAGKGRYADASNTFETTFLESMVRFLSRLRPVFARFGSAELHGCRVARGRNGRRLLQGLARAWNVPVTASLHSQYGNQDTFRFEGRTVTIFPGGGSLKSWARSLPEATQMCVLRI